jgi:hypothetical protein
MASSVTVPEPDGENIFLYTYWDHNYLILIAGGKEKVDREEKEQVF